MITTIMFGLNHEVSFSSSFRFLIMNCAITVKFLIFVLIDFILHMHTVPSGSRDNNNYNLNNVIIIAGCLPLFWPSPHPCNNMMEIRRKNLWIPRDEGWRKMDLLSLRKSTSSPLLKGGRKTLEAWRWDGKDPEFSFQPLKCKFLPLVGRLASCASSYYNLEMSVRPGPHLPSKNKPSLARKLPGILLPLI